VLTFVTYTGAACRARIVELLSTQRISLFTLPLLSLLFFLNSCQKQPSQTGHQHIAVAVRQLLDQSYAGIDYPTYRDSLQKIEGVTAEQLPATPSQLRGQVKQMLTYLRTAEEVLRWKAEKGNTDNGQDDPIVIAWIERYPFLRLAKGARVDAPEVFDPDTALTLLWDKADEMLRQLQVKSKPL
jgi:hypothetical protein